MFLIIFNVKRIRIIMHFAQQNSILLLVELRESKVLIWKVVSEPWGENGVITLC